MDVESAHVLEVLAAAARRYPGLQITPGLFISDVVGGDESLTEKISADNAYVHLQAFLEAYFSQIGIAGVYDAGGELHLFQRACVKANPALVASAQPAADVTRQAILGIRVDSNDFCLLSAPRRRVEYPDFKAMGGHKQIVYVVPPPAERSAELEACLDGCEAGKLFLVFPATTAQATIDLAKGRRFETIVVVEPQSVSYPHADYIISRDSGWAPAAA